MVQGASTSDRTSSDDLAIVSDTATLPATPVSTNSPILNSPLSDTGSASTRVMTSPNVITTVVIQDLHNFVSPEELPKVPALTAQDTEVVLNSSSGTTASIATTSSSMVNHKPGSSPPASHSQQTTPQKSRYKNHNNNQEDINSIESISSFPRFQKNTTDFDWIDDMVQQRNCSEMMHKNKRKKSKKVDSLEADQLDGKIFGYDNDKAKLNGKDDDNDEKVVKCLYYSLMCCDCTIS
ncbi:uncharacterized protein LOC108102922 isoform X2 [Drosophila eugracilis]|nr:uncharacterized protein LOC108102922 isoform X2 [Drosophila eugracilis]